MQYAKLLLESQAAGQAKKMGLVHKGFGQYFQKSPDGSKYWQNKNGQLHRNDGPAVINADGSKFWYQNGKLHRTDGPAVQYADGSKEWWVNGKLHKTPKTAEIKGKK